MENLPDFIFEHSKYFVKLNYDFNSESENKKVWNYNWKIKNLNPDKTISVVDENGYSESFEKITTYIYHWLNLESSKLFREKINEYKIQNFELYAKTRKEGN